MDPIIVFTLLIAIAAGGLALRKLQKAVDSYAVEKGKNRALKEDLDQLTRLVEDIKQQNAILLENHKTRNQLRMAAVERRLQAHQEAFALWRGLVTSTFRDQNALNDKVMAAQTWWENNCLYLEPSAREAFFAMTSTVRSHAELVKHRTEAETIQGSWKLITMAGDRILEAVALPGLTDTEREKLASADGGPGR